jgi:hypothetical protein
MPRLIVVLGGRGRAGFLCSVHEGNEQHSLLARPLRNADDTRQRAPVIATIRWTGVALAKEVARQKIGNPSSRATNGTLTVRRTAARDVRLVHPRSWYERSQPGMYTS